MADSHKLGEFFETLAYLLQREQPVGFTAGLPPCRPGDLVLPDYRCTMGKRSSGTRLLRRTTYRRPRAWEEAGTWHRIHAELRWLLCSPDKLVPHAVIINCVIVRASGGGEVTGTGPVDRGNKGKKGALMFDRHVIALVIRTTRANASDHR